MSDDGGPLNYGVHIGARTPQPAREPILWRPVHSDVNKTPDPCYDQRRISPHLRMLICPFKVDGLACFTEAEPCHPDASGKHPVVCAAGHFAGYVEDNPHWGMEDIWEILK